MRASDILRSLDWIALGATALLIALGLAMLASANYTSGLLSGLFLRQAIAAGLGLFFLIIFAFIHYRTTLRYTWLLYAAGLVGLLSVTIFGVFIRGTVSRLEYLSVQIQPSEFMKVGLLLALAKVGGRFSSVFVLALPLIFILVEPDLGMAALFLASWFGLLIFRGLSWKAVAGLALAAVLTVSGAWTWLLADYQKARLTTFLNPAHDPQGSGYNITQSIIALGSGQLFGRGLGHGPQSQLKFLPERHTDFILASIGEELGFLGILLVLTLYAVLLWRIYAITRNSRDNFVRLYSAGAFILLLVSFTVSAGMNMGLLPVTGIPLPLVSFGGSNLVSTCIILGILQSMRVHGKWTDAPPAELTHF